MNRFLIVFTCTLLSMYFIAVAINVFKRFNDKDEQIDETDEKSVYSEERHANTIIKDSFERTEKQDDGFDVVLKRKIEVLPTSKNFDIELEISETNKHQLI